MRRHGAENSPKYSLASFGLQGTVEVGADESSPPEIKGVARLLRDCLRGRDRMIVAFRALLPDCPVRRIDATRFLVVPSPGAI